MADPGFSERGFKFTNGVCFANFYRIFLKISHEKEISFTQTGERVNLPHWDGKNIDGFTGHSLNLNIRDH